MGAYLPPRPPDIPYMRPVEYISRLLHACVMNVTQMGRCNNAVTRPVPEISAERIILILMDATARRRRLSRPRYYPRRVNCVFLSLLAPSCPTYLFSFAGKEVFSRVNNLDDIARLLNVLANFPRGASSFPPRGQIVEHEPPSLEDAFTQSRREGMFRFIFRRGLKRPGVRFRRWMLSGGVNFTPRARDHKFRRASATAFLEWHGTRL